MTSLMSAKIVILYFDVSDLSSFHIVLLIKKNEKNAYVCNFYIVYIVILDQFKQLNRLLMSAENIKFADVSKNVYVEVSVNFKCFIFLLAH